MWIFNFLMAKLKEKHPKNKQQETQDSSFKKSQGELNHGVNPVPGKAYRFQFSSMERMHIDAVQSSWRDLYLRSNAYEEEMLWIEQHVTVGVKD